MKRNNERPLGTILNENMFRSQKKLEYLSIDCMCTHIHERIFKSQSNLLTLRLKTKVSNIPNKLFHGLYHLQELHIKSQHLNLVLVQTAFIHLTSLETLLNPRTHNKYLYIILYL